MSIPVIQDNDGGHDDLMSALMLWLVPEIDLQAITVSDGNCYVQTAYETLLKMAAFLDLHGAEIGYGDHSVINPFPESWKRQSLIIDQLPVFSEDTTKEPYQFGKPRTSQDIIADLLNRANSPITLVSTAPLTNLALVFQDRPDLKNKVKEIIIMGGAVNRRGNVRQPGHDGSAEWNFFADPLAAKVIFDTSIKKTLIPLNVTSKVPITKDFLSRLEKQGQIWRASRLAAQIYALAPGYFWDTLTAAAAIMPSLFTFKEFCLDVVVQGRSQGKVLTVPAGQTVQVAVDVKRHAFEDLLLSIFKLK